MQTYKPPKGTFFLRQYKGLICSYSESSQLTLFNTVTQDSKTVYFPVIDEYIKDPYRNFEYGYDLLSKKFKVLTYRFENRLQLQNDYVEAKSNFEVFTLGEESTTWRPVKQEFNINLFSEWVTVVGESLFWFDEFVELNEPLPGAFKYEAIPPQIVSFNFTKEELVRIEIPGEVIDFEYYPLFDFEGCLCFVVEAMDSTSNFQWELNVWMLQDIYSSRWMMMKRISLPLGGTNLRYFPKEDTVEFSTQNDEFFITLCDDINQYVFSYNFLSGECKRMKITGEPLCKYMKMIQSLWHDNTDYDSDDDD